MPCTPTAERLSFTSSSLKGLMMASAFFMASSGEPRLCQALAACKGGRGASRSHRLHAHRRLLHRGALGERLVPAAAVPARAEDVRVLAVLRQVEPRELVVLVDAQPARHRPRHGEAD